MQMGHHDDVAQFLAAVSPMVSKGFQCRDIEKVLEWYREELWWIRVVEAQVWKHKPPLLSDRNCYGICKTDALI